MIHPFGCKIPPCECKFYTMQDNRQFPVRAIRSSHAPGLLKQELPGGIDASALT